ncbi:MAG: signal peptidase II [Halarsenatibacteraceae bacterium]
MIKTLIWFLFLMVLDQGSKLYIANNFLLGESQPVIEGIFHLTYVRNTGVSFGLLADNLFLILFLQLIIIFLLVYLKLKLLPDNLFINLCFVLIFAGAIGNIIDRLVYGYVIDFFDFQIWPVFNFADVFIVLGVFGLILFIFKADEL